MKKKSSKNCDKASWAVSTKNTKTSESKSTNETFGRTTASKRVTDYVDSTFSVTFSRSHINAAPLLAVDDRNSRLLRGNTFE